MEGVKECYVRILSQIGKPINEPKALDIEIITEDSYDIKDIEPKAKEIANKWLDNIMEVQKMIVEGKVTTF